MALSVWDEIQSRFAGLFQPALAMIQRATSSPSRPASVAMMRPGDVAALHQALHHAELPRRLRDDDELPMLWEHRQVGHVPLLPLFLIDVRVGQRDQMPERQVTT